METNSLQLSRQETCAVCGRQASHRPGFVRLYLAGRSLETCCPICARSQRVNPLRAAPATARGKSG